MFIKDLPKGYGLDFHVEPFRDLIHARLHYEGKTVEQFTVNAFELSDDALKDEYILDMIKVHQATMIETSKQIEAK